jgi:uncharacterized protein YycO
MRDTILYKAWAGFLKIFDDIMVLFRPPKVKAEHIRKAIAAVKPGYIICRRFAYYLDAYFIRGKYTHSCIVLSEKDVIHAVAEGVIITDIIDYLKDTDGFIILEPPYKNETEIKRVIDFCKKAQESKFQYDFLFDRHYDGAYYCNELIWRAFKSVGTDIPVKRKIIYSEDMIRFCKIIYETPF